MSARIRVGIDVGGTFTDFVLVDESRDLIFTAKRLTTPADPSVAIIEGLGLLLSEAHVSLSEVHSIVHGTTLVTNTIIERTGARVGLITTRGFRDAIEMGRETRYDLYDLFLEQRPALVPRALRREVSERIAPDGAILLPFEAQEFRAAANALIVEECVDAIAVCFMHAYRNSEHERAAKAILEHEFGDTPVSISSEVAPEIREYERASTVCANAYVQPRMQRYLRSLEGALRERGLGGPLYIMLSGGGITTVDDAARFPIRLVESGPAGGAMAASYYGALSGERDLLSFDMGGTTAKMCLIEDARPQRTHEFEAGRVRRFKRGSGLPLKVSVVDMIEIGAGGGSIAHMDRMGLLKVGPRSAGSAPGPVCYARGGDEPTVTDADLLLDYLDRTYFLGGEMSLDTDAARDALREQISVPLNIDTLQAAVGVHSVVNENMAAATRRYLAEKGLDPRRYAMMAFGGAGPVHAYGLAKLLKIERIIVPFGAGVASALGFLVAAPAMDDVRSYVARLEAVDWGRVNIYYDEMEANATERLVAAGAQPQTIRFERSADMRHVGQGFEIQVSLPDGKLSVDQLDGLRSAFFATYKRLFERTVEEVPIEAMSWRLAASAPVPNIALAFSGQSVTANEASKGERNAYFSEFGEIRCAVYDRYTLAPGFAFSGPAIVEERESTTLIGPDAQARVDDHRSLVIEIGRAPLSNISRHVGSPTSVPGRG